MPEILPRKYITTCSQGCESDCLRSFCVPRSTTRKPSAKSPRRADSFCCGRVTTKRLKLRLPEAACLDAVDPLYGDATCACDVAAEMRGETGEAHLRSVTTFAEATPP